MLSDWIVPLKHNKDNQISLLCFHHAGGAASFFKSYTEHITDKINCYAIQLPGREKRFSEICIKNIYQVIHSISEYVIPLLSGKIILFGHSLGALIAYECSKLLCDVNIVPNHLIVSGRNAPSFINDRPISDISDDKILDYLKEFGAIPIEIMTNKNILDVFLPIIRADLAIADSYRYFSNTVLPIPITCFIGKNDKSINNYEIDNWKNETSNIYRKILFKGGHFYLGENKMLFVRKLNEIINNYL